MTSSVNTIIYNIQNKDKSWSWADNEQNMGSLRGCLEAVMAMLDSSDRDILVTDIAVLKAEVGPEAFLNKLGHFCQLCEPLNELAKKHKHIMAMHRTANRS